MTQKLSKFLGFIKEGLSYNSPTENEVRLREDTIFDSGLTRQDMEWCLKKLNRDGVIKRWDVKFAPSKTLPTFPKRADFSSAPNEIFNIAVYILDIDLDKMKNYEVKAHPEDKPRFDDNNGRIYYGGRECEVPLKTNQYFLCKKVFGEPFGKRIKEIDIRDSIDWSKDSDRSVYDAMRLVNKRVKENLGIDEFLQWRNNTIWINEVFS